MLEKTLQPVLHHFEKRHLDKASSHTGAGLMHGQHKGEAVRLFLATYCAMYRLRCA